MTKTDYHRAHRRIVFIVLESLADETVKMWL